jgi:hypothetical protein
MKIVEKKGHLGGQDNAENKEGLVNGRLVFVPTGKDAGTFIPEDTPGEKDSFNAAKGVNYLFARIKFVALPDSRICCHESHMFYCRHWGVDPNNKLAADAFMRTYWGKIVRALNVRRNNSAKSIKMLMKSKTLCVGLGVI